MEMNKVNPKISLCFVYPGKEYSLVSIPVFGYDFEKRKSEVMEKLVTTCPDIDFVPTALYEQEDIDNLAKRKDEFDGFLLYILGWAYGKLPKFDSIGETGKPIVLVSDYLGDSDIFYSEYPEMRRRGFPVVGVASSKFKDVVDALKLFKVIKQMKEAKILFIMEEDKKAGMFGIDVQEFKKALKKIFGTEMVRMTIEEFAKNYLTKISEPEAEAMAEKWINKAERVVEPTREDIIAEAKIYLALKKVIEEEKVDTILFDCTAYAYNFVPDELFKMFYPDKDPKKRGTRKWLLPTAWPCLAIAQLLTDGYAVGDEMNLYSTLNLLVMHYLTKEMMGEPVPGYTGGVIFDFGTGRIIYHLCAAPYKMFGPSGPENPYIIRSHGESHLSATIESLMPIGEKVTVMLIDPVKKVLIMHQGTTVENLLEERWCRNKLAIRADIEKILENVKKKTWFISRTVFYGDWRKPLINLATLLGLEVFEEDK